MYQLGLYRCPQCGKPHDSTGRLGESRLCICGNWLSSSALDRVRRYWIAQIALCFATAAFFIAFALFNQKLPADNWERITHPLLQAPTFASFVSSYLSLVRHKRRYADDDAMFRFYLMGVCLMSVGIIAALCEAISIG